MFKYPFVKQEGLKDCGCASILMILRYYKGNLSIENLRNLTKTGKNGTSAYNMVEACNKIGFSAKGVKCDLSDLKDVILPCIAHVIIDDMYKHYVVIYEINFAKQFLVIGDPDKGIKHISFDKFSKIWTGVLITLYPCCMLPISKNINIGQFIYRNVIKYKSELFLLLFLSLIIILFKIFSSFYFKFIIDGMSISKNYLRSLFLIFLLLSLTKIFIDFLRNKFLIILNCKLDFSLTLDAFKRIVSLPYRYYHNRTSGEIISKINDLGNSRDVISKICVGLFIDLPLVIVSAIFLVRINLTLFFVTLLAFVLYIILSVIYNKIYINWVNIIKGDREKINSFMYESISGFDTVKGIGIESNIIDKFNHKYVDLLNNFYRLQSHINIQGLCKNIVGDIGNLVILFLGSLLVFDNKLSLSYLITYSSMMVYFFEPIRNIIDLDLSFKDSCESIRRVLSLYEGHSDKGVLNFKNGLIEFKNLNFTFDNKENILNNINLRINKGEKIMFYGSSGSGKSTLLKLLMGYYEINRGCIFISGIDINDYKIKSLRKNICYVSQNEILFNDSLINNLKFYSKSNDDIITMTRLCEFNEILSNNMGFNMMIEENGFNLSGGERQRIVLARTFLKQAQIFLIDEGLSQIDVSLERKILSNIFKKYVDKTIIIISHRLENMDLYDRVLHMMDGKICDEK